MGASQQIKVFLVRRLGWEYGDDFYYRTESDDAPVMSFLDPAKAEAHRRELEWAYVRDQKINPFGYIDASLEERSSLPPAQLYRGLRKAGMTLETGREDDRISLWQQYDALPDEGKRRVWGVIDRLRFFEVVQMKVELEG
jgi:hypothetical protein